MVMSCGSHNLVYPVEVRNHPHLHLSRSDLVCSVLYGLYQSLQVWQGVGMLIWLVGFMEQVSHTLEQASKSSRIGSHLSWYWRLVRLLVWVGFGLNSMVWNNPSMFWVRNLGKMTDQVDHCMLRMFWGSGSYWMRFTCIQMLDLWVWNPWVHNHHHQS